MNTLTEAEHAILKRLGKSWDEFLQLPRLHGDEVNEFRDAIHQAQYLVMVRPTRRQLAEDHKKKRAR